MSYCLSFLFSPTCENPEEPTTPTPTSTNTPPEGDCGPNEVIFRPYPGSCEFYTLCACGGAPVLLQCAPGLYWDDRIKQCNFMQLVPCQMK